MRKVAQKKRVDQRKIVPMPKGKGTYSKPGRPKKIVKKISIKKGAKKK